MIKASKTLKGPHLEGNRPTVHKDTRHSNVTTSSACSVCNRSHQVYKCKRFRDATLQQRLMANHQLCFNSLSAGHTAVSCPSEQRCRQCGKAYHTLIHRYESETRLQHRQQHQGRRTAKRGLDRAAQKGWFYSAESLSQPQQTI